MFEAADVMGTYFIIFTIPKICTLFIPIKFSFWVNFVVMKRLTGPAILFRAPKLKEQKTNNVNIKPLQLK